MESIGKEQDKVDAVFELTQSWQWVKLLKSLYVPGDRMVLELRTGWRGITLKQLTEIAEASDVSLEAINVLSTRSEGGLSSLQICIYLAEIGE